MKTISFNLSFCTAHNVWEDQLLLVACCALRDLGRAAEPLRERRRERPSYETRAAFAATAAQRRRGEAEEGRPLPSARQERGRERKEATRRGGCAGEGGREGRGRAARWHGIQHRLDLERGEAARRAMAPASAAVTTRLGGASCRHHWLQREGGSERTL